MPDLPPDAWPVMAAMIVLYLAGCAGADRDAEARLRDA
jgi:hypothetical protein